MSDDIEEVKRLYNFAQECTGNPLPKSRLLGWKCPGCGAKLKRKSLKHPISTEVGGTEFAHEVVEYFDMPAGFYSLNLEHFKCKCGYEYVTRKLERVELE